MIIYTVSSPDEASNPFLNIICKEDRLVVYHGTGQTFGERIEREGFAPNLIPYEMPDIQTIIDAYEHVGWFGTNTGGYNVLKTFTTGSDGSHKNNKPISFTIHYSKARDYARNPGGETISNIFKAIDEFQLFCENHDFRQKCISRLEEDYDYLRSVFKSNEKVALSNPDPRVRAECERMKRIPRLISNCEDEAKLTNILENLLASRMKYNDMAANHMPVVYLVAIEKASFENGSRTDDLRLIYPISPLDILAKVVFPRGINSTPVRGTSQKESEEWLKTEENWKSH